VPQASTCGGGDKRSLDGHEEWTAGPNHLRVGKGGGGRRRWVWGTPDIILIVWTKNGEAGEAGSRGQGRSKGHIFALIKPRSRGGSRSQGPIEEGINAKRGSPLNQRG